MYIGVHEYHSSLSSCLLRTLRSLSFFKFFYVVTLIFILYTTFILHAKYVYRLLRNMELNISVQTCICKIICFYANCKIRFMSEKLF